MKYVLDEMTLSSLACLEGGLIRSGSLHNIHNPHNHTFTPHKVADGVFRSGYPIACNFPFLKGLRLRSILCLCPEDLLPGSLEWANEAGVRIEKCNLGENSHPFVSMTLATMRKAVDFLSGD